MRHIFVEAISVVVGFLFANFAPRPATAALITFLMSLVLFYLCGM